MRTVPRRRLPGSLLITAVLTALWIGAGGVAIAAPAPGYPVNYDFFSGIPDELAHPGGSLPGSNDRSCRPSAAHPDPVVLVHGTGGGAQTNGGVYAPLPADAGYCVYALTYGALDVPWPLSAIGGMAPIESGSAQLAGTSAFLRSLDADGVYHPQVTYTNIETRYDEAIVPYTVGLVPGPHTTNILVQDGCPADFSDHAGVAGSARAATFALNALDPAHPRPVPCHFTAPLTGG